MKPLPDISGMKLGASAPLGSLSSNNTNSGKLTHNTSDSSFPSAGTKKKKGVVSSADDSDSNYEEVSAISPCVLAFDVAT